MGTHTNVLNSWFSSLFPRVPPSNFSQKPFIFTFMSMFPMKAHVVFFVIFEPFRTTRSTPQSTPQKAVVKPAPLVILSYFVQESGGLYQGKTPRSSWIGCLWILSFHRVLQCRWFDGFLSRSFPMVSDGCARIHTRTPVQQICYTRADDHPTFLGIKNHSRNLINKCFFRIYPVESHRSRVHYCNTKLY